MVEMLPVKVIPSCGRGITNSGNGSNICSSVPHGNRRRVHWKTNHSVAQEKAPAAVAFPDVSISAHLHPFIHQLRAIGWPTGPRQHTRCKALSPHINMIEKYEYYNLITATYYKEHSS